jgi:tetratricopeptide (TPR) repeat protein
MQSEAALREMLNKALALQQAGEFARALNLYRKLLTAAPESFDALHLLGVCHMELGQTQQAIDLITRALAIHPGSAGAHNNLGLALDAAGKPQQALDSYNRAVTYQPDFAEAHSNRGLLLLAMGQAQSALQCFDRAIALRPTLAQCHSNRGNAMQALGRPKEALACYDRALALAPGFVDAWYNRAASLLALQQHAAALDSYDRAHALQPQHAQVLINRSNLLLRLQRHAQAMRDLELVLRLRPSMPEAHNNLGYLLSTLGQTTQAVERFQRAIKLRPDYAEAHYNLACSLQKLQQYAQALASFDRARALDPERPYLLGDRLHARMQACEWAGHAADLAQLVGRIEAGERASPCFPVLALIDDPALQCKAAQTWVADRHPACAEGVSFPAPVAAQRIRIGYFSADFRQHPVALLMAGVFESHDRQEFEITGFSYGRHPDDAMRERIRVSLDRYEDVRDQSDAEVAALARSLGIDIAIDLGGYTEHARTGIFAARAAPVQLGYLGYLGSMGAPYMDYILADETLIPPAMQQHYQEQIAYLPSYQANDFRVPVEAGRVSRASLNIPEQAFVFACFNNNYKITPFMFDSWMRILQQVPDSVLYLYVVNALAQENLQREAQQRGVAADRLLFAERLAMSDYLSRYQCCDLYLDTLPYNAGTTASDALWAGLPLLTCRGHALAARMGASLLQALDLPELITESLADYERMAITLAQQPQRLAELRARLQANRDSARLFDTRRFTRSLEQAYTRMQQRRLAGESPQLVRVSGQD